MRDARKIFEGTFRIRVAAWAGATFVVFLVLLCIGFVRFNSEASGKWVTTWSGAVQHFQVPGYFFGQGPPPKFEDVWRHGVLDNQTVRLTVRSTVSGSRVRIRLSNAFGEKPLTIGAASIIKLASGSTRKPGSSSRGQQGQQGMGRDMVMQNLRVDVTHPILFKGQPSLTIPPAGIAMSDPIHFEVRDREFLSVSLYLPNRTESATVVSGLTAAQFFSGNATGTETPEGWRYHPQGSFWLSSVDVFASRESKAIIILDDDSRCCDLLRGPGWGVPWTDRLLANGRSDRFAVIESSVPACPMLGNCPAGILARIQEAVQNRSGVQWVIVSAGFEDIVRAGRGAGFGSQPTNTRAEDVINALKMVSDAAHGSGLRIGVATYPPFDLTWRYTEKSEDIRQAVNQWIRDSRTFDAVLDFDQAVRDRRDPRKRFSVFEGQPSIFYGSEGFRVMSDLIDPTVFAR